MSKSTLRFVTSIALLLLPVTGPLRATVSEPRELTFVDLMQFRTIRDPAISKNGSFLAYELRPDRGDPEVVLRAIHGEAVHRVALGTSPQVAADGRWAAVAISLSLEEKEKTNDKDDEDGAKPGLALVNLEDGSEERFERVESFRFSEDGRWVAWKHFAEQEEKEEEEEETAEQEKAPTESSPENPVTTEEQASGETQEPGPSGVETSSQGAAEETTPEASSSEEATTTAVGEAAEEADSEDEDDEELGTRCVLRDLRTGASHSFELVTEFAFDEASQFFAFATAKPQGVGNAVQVWRLAEDQTSPLSLASEDHSRYTHLTWARKASVLGFVAAPLDEEGDAQDGTLWAFDGTSAQPIVTPDAVPDRWTIPSINQLSFSDDGERLFFGLRPVDDIARQKKQEAREAEQRKKEGNEAPFQAYDFEDILEDREVDVWHWNDPLIIPNQKEDWEDEQERTYLAVYHRSSDKFVPLADQDMRNVQPAARSPVALATADTPYLRERTWDGFFEDLAVVDLESGNSTTVARRLAESHSLSPHGRYVIYYQDEHWYLYDVASQATRNLTASLDVTFANEDHDYPRARPDYGHAEWLSDDSAALIYDKYDLWKFPTDGSDPVNLTANGRAQQRVYRVVDRDPEEDSIAPGSALLLRGYDDREKHDGWYRVAVNGPGVTPLYTTGKHRLRFIAQAEDSKEWLFTRENFGEYPNLWVTSADLESNTFPEPRPLTNANPQIGEFAWGSAELVEWSSLDGEPLQGVLIKPANWDPNRRYPVLVYFYRFFSQRLHQFNAPVVNHRPSFSLYTSQGYAVFLPDIRFDVGQPGFSATKCLVPGVQKLVDLGIADPDAIGLHGHSWSGYQTAFVITQTDLFAAAVAGAPVSNMTSAYSGIRWGSGLARQFQYEKSQSRIGGSLWEYPERYIENSPVFFADRIQTPLLIQFGDEDEAVPWYQGIELYLACRRQQKDCIFLQYRGEPHHLKKYANKLDYSIKMKEFFDHHLKGEPAPDWMTHGVPYRKDP